MATKIRRTLYIGLGGTGMNALLRTKKMLYDTYGEIPPMIGFLGIDTDGGVYNKELPAKDGTKIYLTTAEQLPISVQTPSLTYSRDSQKYDWLPAANAAALTQLNIGAGQVRSNGRFALTLHEEDIANRLNAKIQQINSASIIDNQRYGLLSTDTEVHMIFSLSGGTGCGTFINMAYLIKRLLPQVKLSGYAVMADVFRAMIQGAGTVRVRPNAYGAIIDLDYLMHLDPNSKPVKIKWLRNEEETCERPFTALYFIDNKNVNEDAFTNVDQLCEMISLALVTSAGELSVATASVSDNVAKVISDGSMDLRNKRAWAAGFGVSEIVLNNNAIASIYSNKARLQLIARMLNGGCDDPSQIANAWIDEIHIRENLGKDDVIDYFMSATPPRDLSDLDNLDNSLPECNYFINNIAMEPEKELNEKLEALKEKVGPSLDNLLSEQVNRECGVYIAEHILHAILKQIELCDTEMKDELKERKDNLPLMESALEARCKELSDCMSTFLKLRKKDYINDVCASAMTLSNLRREIKRRELAREFYNWLRIYVNKAFDRINIIISNLHSVQEQSTSAVETIRQNLGSTSFFQFELALNIVNRIVCEQSDIVFNDFVHSMTPEGGVMAFSAMTAEQTAERLKRFTATLPKTKQYQNLTVDDLLNKMSNDELAELCRKAINKSLPLFPYNYHGYDADVKSRPADNYYVGVCNKDVSPLTKDNLFKSFIPDQPNVQFVSTGIPDRVIIYRQQGVVPAFTLSSLDAYKPEYDRFEKDKEFTSHWDVNLCRRMKSEHFSLEPRDVESKQQILGLWVKSILYGIITRDAATDMYQIKSKVLGGRPLNGFKVNIGKTRKDAFEFFTENLPVLKSEINSRMEELDIPGPDNILIKRNADAKRAANDGTYLSEISLCPISIEQIELYPDEANLINDELEYILNNL